ncbi:family 39 glycosyltransferase [Melampsora americana]|nr:family 39 glycosyltransferase [Melampsora americana]
MTHSERLPTRRLINTRTTRNNVEDHSVIGLNSISNQISTHDSVPSSPSSPLSSPLSDKNKYTYKRDKREEHQRLDHFLDSNVNVYNKHDLFLIFLVGLVAAYLRFRHISHPSAVTFDEVHFGKFTSYYLKREFFFDVHPPLAKLMLAFQGWLIGYDGEYPFENIGDDYLDGDVPYVGLRSMSAFIGSLTVSLVYAIMKESGYPTVVNVLSACLIAFDNGHIVQTRLILLDAPLIFFMACSLFCYIKFYKQRYHEFRRSWWTWLFLTGLSLSLTISCKMVGLFTFFTIGMAVAIDLWGMLDIKRGHPMDHIIQHVSARILGLIVFPAIVYLFWFWVHFSVLINSGTGDEFMTAAFQETLIGSPLTLASEEIHYNDTITLQHRATKCFLHSHPQKYPVKYDDGRVSSQGQQVTCYPHNDTNNHWRIEATKPILGKGREQIVRHNDIIRLKHIATESYLFTHDVASPSLATNQEFTTWPSRASGVTQFNETKFKVVIDDAHTGKQWKTKSGHFQLRHVETGVAMWTRSTPLLPDWGYGQQEVNGHKVYTDRTLLWVADSIIRDNNTDKTRPPEPVPKSIGKRSFLKKYLELQIAMLQHNSGLTESHPYASPPINWPFLLAGVSFWTSSPELRQQVYMAGNVLGWWFCMMCMSIITGIMGADQFARRRGISPIPDHIRNRLYNSGGFFILAWLFHYLPFYMMNRQRFLHHYLPAHLCSTLVAGSVFNFIITDSINYPVSIAGPTTRRRRSRRADVPKHARMILLIMICLLWISFNFFAPLTYGTPGLSAEEVQNRKILSSWQLHFAK